MKCKEEYLKIK